MCESGRREGARKSSVAFKTVSATIKGTWDGCHIPITTARRAAALLTSLAVELMVVVQRKEADALGDTKEL